MVTAESRAVMVRIAGLAMTLAYASLIVWLYSAQPQTVAEVTGSLSSTVGVYQVDAQAMADALAFFRRDAFPEARMAFERADPAHHDARTQFYIAYSYYREGWGRTYDDNALFTEGLAAVNRAINLNPNSTVVVDDPNLQMHTAAELRSELEQGTETSWTDLNPLKLFRQRK